jgi:hypothetical protein
MGGSGSKTEPIEVVHAQEEDVEEDVDEQYDDDYGEEETEEQWRARREGSSSQSRLDTVKRMLAVSFFAGLGIIVIVVAATSMPLITPNPEDLANSTVPFVP